MSKSSWVVTLSAIFSGIAIAVIQNKVIPCLDALQAAFSINMTTAGLLSSIFCIMGIFAAFPAAVITNRLGVKKACLYSLICGLMGSVIGVFSSSVFTLMIGRVIEGIGAGIISIAVPSVIAMWFPPEKRGLPTGLWSSWQYVAQALCFFFGVSITERFHWHGVWYAGALIALVGAILCVIFVREPNAGEGFISVENAEESVSIRAGLQHRSAWFTSAAMLCFNFACFGFVTWAAKCWCETLEITLDTANQYVSLFAIISLPVVVVIGLLMDRVDHRHFAVGICFGYAITAATAFLLPTAAWILPFVIIYPLFEGGVSTALWVMIPSTVSETKYISIAVALFTLASNVGMLIGPPIVGAVAEAYGWKACAFPILISMLLGTICVYFAKEYKN